MPEPTITLFTPTLNRPEYMVRLLKYYQDIGFKGRISIGDSSDEPHARETEQAVYSMQGGLDVVHQRFPGINGVECVYRLLESVTTKYAAFASDDDFFVPTALDDCMAFLDANPGYSAAHGLGTLLSVASNAAYGPVTGTGYYEQPEVEDDSPSARLKSLLADYSVTLFSVHRTETWQAMYQEASAVREWRRFGGELLQCSRSVIDGKVKQLDCLSLVRQVYDYRNVNRADLNSETEDTASNNAQRINMTASSKVDEFEWLTGEDWLPSFTLFRDKVSKDLAHREGIDGNEAQERVKQAFWPYLLTALNKSTGNTHAVSQNQIKSVGGLIPGARKSWRMIKSLVPKGTNQMSLEGLLLGSSRYHQGFMPIYRMVTTGSAVSVPAGKR